MYKYWECRTAPGMGWWSARIATKSEVGLWLARFYWVAFKLGSIRCHPELFMSEEKNNIMPDSNQYVKTNSNWQSWQY